MTRTTTLLPFQPDSMTPAQLAAVSFLARYSGQTHIHYAMQLRRWFTWCETNGLDPLIGIQRAHVELYIHELGASGLMDSSIKTMMHGVRGLFRFAHIDGTIPSDPAVYARLPKIHSDESRTQGLDHGRRQGYEEQARDHHNYLLTYDERLTQVAKDAARFALLDAAEAWDAEGPDDLKHLAEEQYRLGGPSMPTIWLRLRATRVIPPGWSPIPPEGATRKRSLPQSSRQGLATGRRTGLAIRSGTAAPTSASAACAAPPPNTRARTAD